MNIDNLFNSIIVIDEKDWELLTVEERNRASAVRMNDGVIVPMRHIIDWHAFIEQQKQES